MKIWFDTEFVEDGKTIDLLSIGMVREDGATYYAEPQEAKRHRASEWVRKNVLPHLHGPIKPRAQIATEIIDFAGTSPEFWAYYADYDWVALCQLYGTMIGLPDGWPMFCRDVIQECKRIGNPTLPKMEGTTHNALDDAVWCKQAWEFVVSKERAEISRLQADLERFRKGPLWLVREGRDYLRFTFTDDMDAAMNYCERHDASWVSMMPLPPPPDSEPPRCRKCGYSYADCQLHGDHHLCGEPNPPPPESR